MTTLSETRTQGERTYFQPVLTRITGMSQYRDDEYRLEGIEGFWAAGKVEIAQAVRDGAVAWFTLTTKPKLGVNARPGALYRDIVSIKPATAEDKESYAAQVKNDSYGSGADYVEKRLGGSANTAGGNIWEDRDRQIKLGMAFNNLTTLLASGKLKGDEAAKSWDTWRQWFEEASQGKRLTPLTYGEEESSEAEAVEIGTLPFEDEQTEEPVQQEIEELPW